MEEKKLKNLVLTSILAGGMLWSSSVLAEELQEFTLDPMVITATRTNMTIKETPSAVEEQ